MPNWKLNNRTGLMEPKTNPEQEIANIISKITPKEVPIWSEIKTIRDGLAIANGNNQHYLLVRLNNSWRCCGVIKDYRKILKYANGPLVDFHRVWLSGFNILDPKHYNTQMSTK